jgi:hypothetical protein
MNLTGALTWQNLPPGGASAIIAGMQTWIDRFYSKRYWVYFVLIAIAYVTSVDIPFYFDDVHSLRDNVALLDPRNWYQHWLNPELTSSLPANRSYRPLTFMIYNLLMVAGGGGVLLFHLHKLVLLFGICVLVEKIWNRLAGREGRFGFGLACLWAVHPALSESTVYLSATSSLQAAYFYFLGYWLFLKQPERWWPVLLAYAASCFSKEEGITLPATLLLTAVLEKRLRSWLRPIAILSAAGIFLFIFIQTRIPAAQSVSRGAVPPIDYLITQTRAWLHYMTLWLWPAGLNADNTGFGFSSAWTEPKVLVSLLLQAGLLLGAWLARRQAPLLLFGLLWYYVTISPASSIIPLAEPVNERRMIIAYLGFTGALYWWITWTLEKAGPRAVRDGTAVFVAILVAATAGTLYRVQTWRDPIRLWQDVVSKNPDSVRALNNLASEKITQGDFTGALADVQKCLEQAPYLYCKINEGIALTQLRRFADAGAAFEYAVRNSSNNATPHYYYADYWFTVGDYQNALTQVEIALRISGGNYVPALQLRERILQARAQPH